MEIAHACQVQIEELVNQDFDLAIFGVKQYERSSFLLRNYRIKTQHTLALIDTDDQPDLRKIEPGILPVSGLDLLEIASNDGERVVAYLEKFTGRSQANEIKILIDYS